MHIGKQPKTKLKKSVFGTFFVMLAIISNLLNLICLPLTSHAISNDSKTVQITEAVQIAETIQIAETTQNNQSTRENQSSQTTIDSQFDESQTSDDSQTSDNSQSSDDPQTDESETTEDPQTVETTEVDNSNTHTDTCQEALGAIGWLVCPTTGKLAEAVDWLYDKLEDILQINPVEAKDGSPIYEVWKVFLSFTNFVFIIFVLVVVYSQITGYGINNYGIKKALPKLIVAAIMVNLSFLICSLAVDISNIVGNSIRGIFTSVEETVAQNAQMNIHLTLWDNMAALISGGALAVGATFIAFETGAIWMLIPVVLGAIVAVVAGLLTIAMRQAVIILLIIISPLAIVGCILPNTEQWFQKWKQLFLRMLIFYPMFSLLFGASSLAGFTIISSATDGFGLLLGAAVQIFPLFFSWSLMKMSGTFLENINAKVRSIGASPVAKTRGYADLRRQAAKQKHLAGRAYTPSMKLMQFMSNRRVLKETDLSNHQQMVRNRGLAYRANRNYKGGVDSGGAPTRRGERAYAEQATNMGYERQILRDENNFNKGLGAYAANTRQRARLSSLDNANVNASDYLKFEKARGERINYQNSKSFYDRMEKAINVHADRTVGFERTVDADGNEVLTPRKDYKFHFDTRSPKALEQSAEMARYNALNRIMEGNVEDVYYAAASAAKSYDTNHKIIQGTMDKYFDLTVPTKDIEFRLTELTKSPNAVENIDSIVSGLRILNQRGDLDIVRKQIKNVLDQGVGLGTHASQELGNFLMFEIKDRDPFLRRFGKYINLETAMVYGNNGRQKATFDFDEFVTGEYQQVNPETGRIEVKKAKMGLPTLMLGTPLDNFERKSIQNLEDLLIEAYTDENGHLDTRAYLAQRDAVQTAMAPQFISASLKFLSGSDQIKTLTAFLTGYDDKGKARWEPGGDLAEDAEYARDYFQRKTLQYINDQTPNNILGLRSDYYSPLVEHLSSAYQDNDTSHWSDEDREEYERLMAQREAIEARYAGLSPEEAETSKNADPDYTKLKSDMAGAEFRHLLDDKGKLDQIYRTRNSSASNNAKDWVRDWLRLDDTDYIMEHRRRGRETTPEHPTGSDPAPAEPETHTTFDVSDREGFAAHVQNIYDHLNPVSSTPEDFYNDSLAYISETLRDSGTLIEHRYARYHDEHPDATSSDLNDYLQSLINDPTNY